MIRKLITAAVLAAAFTAPAFAANDIAGNWTTQSGETAAITACGAAMCITLKTGKHAGKQIGSMSGKDGRYRGTITDPADDKTYKGKASINGSSMKMSGCIAGGLLCKTQTWKRQ